MELPILDFVMLYLYLTYLANLDNIPGNNIPDLSLYSLFLCLLGSIFQVLFTYVLMKVFAHKTLLQELHFLKQK